MTKLSISCESWKPMQRNTLQGFATIFIGEIELKITDVAIHAKGDRRWAQLPARPWVKNGALVTGDDGKVQYSPVIEFARREVADAFSRAVVDAILKVDPHALEMAEAP
jgi:hypothetical protein